MRIAFAAVIASLPSIVACGSAQPTPHQRPPNADVRFATSAGNELVLWRVTATSVASEQRITFDDPITDIAWLDAQTPVVLFEDLSVARVVDGKAIPFEPIPAEAWVAPRPDEVSEDDGEMRPGSEPAQIFGFDGQVWLMRCLWEYGYEGVTCETVRWVRVHPSFEQQDHAPPLPPLREAPTVAAPKHYELVEQTREVDEGEQVATVGCGLAGGEPTTLPLFDFDAQDDFTEMFDARDPRWIRASPPRFVVTALVPGMDAHDAEVVVEGCPPTSARTVSEHRVGPHGVWAWTGYERAWQLEGAPEVVPAMAVDHLEFAPVR